MQHALGWLRRIFQNAIYALPIHRTIFMVKNHLAMFAFWLILILLIGGYLGKTYGMSYLFLGPEYLNQESFWSFFMVGLAMAGFIASFHITSYILDAYRYSFLGTIYKPFLCFSLNNSLIPAAFLGYYIYKIIQHQILYENASYSTILLKVSGLVVGMLIMFSLVSLYFSISNKRVLLRFANRLDRTLKKRRLQRVNVMERLNRVKQEKIILTSYVGLSGKIHPIIGSYQHDKSIILKVFDQTQLNAIIIQFVSLISLFLLGLYRDIPAFQLPAAASIFLLLSVLLMFLGAVAYWFKEWAVTVGVSILIAALHYFPSNTAKNPYHQAFGIEYNTTAEYTVEALEDLSSPTNFHSDTIQTAKILSKWKAKAMGSSWNKPKMVFICSSGGGLLASLWSLRSLQYLDSATHGQLMEHTMLMTGSSGGMLGNAYFRELYLQSLSDSAINLYSKEYTRKIALDKLNPTVFSLVAADLLFRFQTFRIAGKTHYRDRGYSLERQILIDTDYVLDKPIIDYQKPEADALIPMMIIAPTIVNDGRKLYISPQPISYMNLGQPSLKDNREMKVRGVEFGRLLASQDADSLRMMTALRMNATFPYITPNVILPTNPPISIMDAGLSDNFGITDAIHFMYVFKDWINANTSGVVLLSLRVVPKEKSWVEQGGNGSVSQVFAPISGVLGNLFSLQDMNNEADIEYIEEILDVPLEQINFEYFNKSNRQEIEEASLSWRLTRREQLGILKEITSPYNQKSLERLKKTLSNP